MPTHFRRRPAFSLIELLIVLVAIGVVVGIVVPRFQAYRQRAHVAAMIGDLRELAHAEESYWNAVKSYTTDPAMLNFAPSRGVVFTLHSADSTGWSARVSRAGDPTVCSIFYGTAPPLPPAVRANVIGCGEEGEEREQRAESREQKAESSENLRGVKSQTLEVLTAFCSLLSAVLSSPPSIASCQGYCKSNG